MHHILGPALGALFFIQFRELFSIWSSNWLLWFGLIFVAFGIETPHGLIAIWEQLNTRGPGRRGGGTEPALAPAAGRSGCDEQAQDLPGLAAAGVPAAGKS